MVNMYKKTFFKLTQSSTYTNLCNNYNNFAYTLAEVLIALGIIGVVAAITIPTLVANYNEKQWNTAATVFDKKLEDTLKTMNTQQTLAGHSSTESFVEELSKHFKTNKICQNNELLDCFSDYIYWGGGEATPEKIDMSKIKFAKNFGQDSWDTNIVGVQFANGTNALIAYNPITTGDFACTQDPFSNEINGQNCLAILYDTSGEKNPNTSGKDIRSNPNITNLGSTCVFEIGSSCYTVAPFTPTPITKAECEEIKESLGINECANENDYWAGAVKACGGINKLPSKAHLAEIANYVYNRTDIIGDASKYNLKRDDEKALSLGFQFTTGSYFAVWSREEYSAHQAYYRNFNPGSANLAHNNRGDIVRQAICIEE